MHITDPIADMLTRIRNANNAKHDTVDIPASNMKKAIAQILLDEGYIKAFQIVDDGTQGVIHVTLKYNNPGKEKVITGLRRYGYDDLARSIKEKTLAAVNLWFERTGQVFEFFDPQNEIAPWKLNRKGEQPPVPDYRIRYHAITDYNWSACFTLLLIQEG